MRYIALVLLNLPLILLALINIVTLYKMGRVERTRFRRQLILWMIILIVLIGSFPVYNWLSGKPLLDSSALSSFDIIQTTTIVYLIYIINDHRRKIERSEKTIRELHQELSIIISTKK